MQLNPSGNIHINNTVRDYSLSGNHHFNADPSLRTCSAYSSQGSGHILDAQIPGRVVGQE
jgi:hypothetical protein